MFKVSEIPWTGDLFIFWPRCDFWGGWVYTTDIGYPLYPGVMANIYLSSGTNESNNDPTDYIDYANLTIKEVIEK